jgi:MFS family permease
MGYMKQVVGLPFRAKVVLLGLFLISIGGFIVVPFLAVYLNKVLRLSLAEVGIILSARVVCQRGLLLAGGMASDKFGRTAAMHVSLATRLLSYVGLMFARDFYSLLLLSSLIGASSAVFMPASKAALSTMVGDDDQVLMFSVRNAINNAGVALGGVFGAFLIGQQPVYLFAAAALVQFVCLLLFLAFVRVGSEREVGCAPSYSLGDATSLFRSARLQELSLYTLLFFALYIQLEFTLPLHAAEQYGNYAVALIFVINSVIIIVIQVPFSMNAARRLPLRRQLALAFAMMGLAYLMVGTFDPVAAFVVGIALFTIGELAFEPAIDASLPRFISGKSLGTAFGILGLAALIGVVLGNNVGSVVFEALGRGGAYWFVLAAVALGGSAVVWLVSLSRAPSYEEDTVAR